MHLWYIMHHHLHVSLLSRATDALYYVLQLMSRRCGCVYRHVKAMHTLLNRIMLEGNALKLDQPVLCLLSFVAV